MRHDSYQQKLCTRINQRSRDIEIERCLLLRDFVRRGNSQRLERQTIKAAAKTERPAICVSDPALPTALTVTTLMFLAAQKSLSLRHIRRTSCHLDGQSKTARVNKNSLDVPNLEETWCAVARGIRLRSRSLRAHCHSRSSEGIFKYRRTFRAVDMCARGNCQHFCTDGRESNRQVHVNSLVRVADSRMLYPLSHVFVTLLWKKMGVLHDS